MSYILYLFILSILATKAMSVAVRKTDCQERCGSLAIPYPFGTEASCYHDSDFQITCDKTRDPPKAYMRTSNLEVRDISLEGELTILNLVSSDCYSESGENTGLNTWLSSGFKVSDSKNKFTAFGCDTSASITGTLNDETYETGCISKCASETHVSDSCSGIGCCQISIATGMTYYNISVSSYKNHKSVLAFNPCSYAFVIQENQFNFSKSMLRNFSGNSTVPMILDWGIGTETCEVATESAGSYACGGNTTCKNRPIGSGYLCNCFSGYQGNPYINCEDINECKEKKHNCERDDYCTNINGNFTCSCPKGYYGDGRVGGKGCIARQSLVTKIALSTTVSVTGFLVAFTWVFWMLKKRKLLMLKESYFRKNGGVMLQQQLSNLRERSNETTKIYTAQELEKATDFYAESRIIGRGGYGTVYRGVLVNNKIVAIKKSKVVDETQVEQFINEVIVLSQINHRNVVKLLGCCLEEEVPLLVYEYIPNGTLFDQIHNRSINSLINWDTALRIATETAGVLSYLHSTASPPIIHRDIKSTNILLDENFTAKVSDFGASRLVPTDEKQLSTMVQGTLGYLDPEYMQTSQLTEKSDVYSFGALLIELLTKRKVICFNKPEKEKNLAMYFTFSLRQGRLLEILDSRLVREASADNLMRIADLARRCLSLKGDDRPTMKEVYMELEGLKEKAPKHAWDSDINLEETEHLIEVPSETFEIEGTRDITMRYDSIVDHRILEVHMGR